MNPTDGPVTVVVPGDLHLTSRGRDNYAAALCVIHEVNEMIRPDFVQFIGDNVQDATNDQFDIFQELTGQLDVPHFTLVGDHDVVGDPEAKAFRQRIGEPCGSMVLRGTRFVRLNTLDIPRLGFSDGQLTWLCDELQTAQSLGERVVVFQHHYPFKVCEQFTGPGVERWRELVDAHRPVAIICGHTHYGQIANDGRKVAIATRSIGDPEGGEPGYLVVFLHGDDFAVGYRTVDETGPFVLITHPRDLLLATDARHIVHDDDELRVQIWSKSPVAQVSASLADGLQIDLELTSAGIWSGALPLSRFTKGEHAVRVEVRLRDGQSSHQHLSFYVDRTQRFTAVPDARPVVRTTAFC